MVVTTAFNLYSPTGRHAPQYDGVDRGLHHKGEDLAEEKQHGERGEALRREGRLQEHEPDGGGTCAHRHGVATG